MSVEINGLPRGQIQNSGENRQVTSAKSATSSAAQQPSRPSNDDKVSLTSSATHLQELSSRVAQLPVADPEIVAEIQRTVATGGFQIQPAIAADNLLTQEKELATLEVQT